MSIDPLKRLLSRHTPTDAKEVRDLSLLLESAAKLEAPFSRAQPGAHFTGSAVVVSADGRRVLLLHHAKLNRWLQPGGHAEPADDGELLRTALREAREETALEVEPWPGAPVPLDVDAHEIPPRRDVGAHLHLDVRFLLAAAAPERLAHDPVESHGARWLGWDEALAIADEPALRRMLEKARRLVEPPSSGS